MRAIRQNLGTRVTERQWRRSTYPPDDVQIQDYVETLNNDDGRLALQVASDERHLHRFERSVYSQNGEDGIIAEIFSRIGTTDRTFIEIGASDGSENCTAALLEQDWEGIWVEGDGAKAARARRTFHDRRVVVVEAFVDRDSVVSVLAPYHPPDRPDLLVIDIDGNDYAMWKSIGSQLHARVVVIEYNAVVGPRSHWVLPYRADHRWDETCRHGAGLAALAALGSRLGYTLVGCDSRGVNAFFVSAEESPAFTHRPVCDHYVTPRYGLPFGHPPHRARPFEAPPVPAEEVELLRLSVLAPWPAAVRPGGMLFVHAVVHNGTSVPVGHPTTTAVPMMLASWWTDETGRSLDGEAERSVQAWKAGPGGTAHLVGRATAPKVGGRYRLAFGLVQESVRWHGPPGTVDLGVVTVA